MLLKLTTIAAAFLVWAPVAQAWSWPVQGPVLQRFSYDPAHPYAAGQHRGIDIGAATTGGPVVAPASGTVSFAGSVPTSGKCVTIETPDGYSVTLTHLGSLAVAKGATVAEGDVVATVGPSGTPEQASPYVHLGIRSTGDANAYLDPLGLLPALNAPSAGSTGGSASAGTGAADGSSSVPVPAPTPAPVSAPSPAVAAPTAASGGAGLVVRSGSAAQPAAPAQPHATTTQHHARDQRPPAAEGVTRPLTVRRPVEEPTRGRPAASEAPVAPVLARPAPVLMPLALGAGPGILAAVAALATAAVRLQRRRRPPAAVFRHPLCVVPPEEDEMRRAA